MPKSDNIELENRIRQVQEWIIDDYTAGDIEKQCVLKWEVSDRQARRYIAEARDRWLEDDKELIDNKRRLKVQTLKKLKRSILDRFKGTPHGIMAILRVESKIIELEGIKPATKLEIDHKNTNDEFNDMSDAELKELLKTTVKKID